MKKNYFFTLLFAFSFSLLSFGQIVINEVDADTDGTDVAEFIELKWTPNTPLDGYVVVLFNGSDDKSYFAFDLDGKTTDANGFFILANSPLVTDNDIDIGASNILQNGADAVAIYQANETDFPNDTEITLTGLIDVVIYDTNDGDDTGLLTGFGKTEQYNEGENGSQSTQSIQRLEDGSYTTSDVTFRAENVATDPCVLNLFNYNTTCDAVTSGVDNYTATIDFSGGNTGITYTLNSDVGTISGDSPTDLETGTITISGVPEGTDINFTLVGGTGSSCDFSESITSPNCVGLPIEETFDYTGSEALSAQSSWLSLNSGDDIVVADGSLSYEGLKSSVGNSITFDGSGAESYTTFADITSGIVYASFLLKVSDISSMTDLTDGGYFASLAGGTSSYDVRLWVRPNPDASGSTFDIGFGPESSSPPFTSTTYSVNDVLFVVMAFNMDNGLVSTWINPDTSSFEGTIPTATLSSTDTTPPSSINLFILRQDSSGETPSMQIDELRISDSWADVTPKDTTASIDRNQIEGFATYPNPVTNNQFTITSNSIEIKEISIFNVIGKRVLSTSVVGTKSTIDVSSIASGLYILKVTEGNKTATSKLVIE
ncbi:T9SS type A sorting domain-containing protein [Polaribacter sp. R77954]|uniref:T9SS type A sorting domain-containing protein n=1 Tax=Polaribacter sp. R77954 TaxID=3093870 RepID=UPI0037CB3629